MCNKLVLSIIPTTALLFDRISIRSIVRQHKTQQRLHNCVLADKHRTGRRTDTNIRFTCYYSNVYPTRCNVTQFILSGNCSTCFGLYLHPSSGAQTTVSTAPGICHTFIAICRYRGRVGTDKYQML